MMRGLESSQQQLFSYINLEERIPANHSLRPLKVLVDSILKGMDQQFDAVYSQEGRPSIPPERLLRASLVQVLFTIRSERQLVEHIEYNLLYRWFVGLGIDEAVWDHSTFTQNRDRLLDNEMAGHFFTGVKELASWPELSSDAHFSIDGTLLDAWASHKSFVRKDGDNNPPDDNTRNPTRDFKGEKRSNATHESTTDPGARLVRKSDGDASRLCYMGHVLMENRNGLVVDVSVSAATGTAEREESFKLLQVNVKSGATVGEDRGYDTDAHIKAVQELGIIPHVAAKHKGSAVTDDICQSEGYAISLKTRKRIEEVFGWMKTVG
jgi:transposase